MKVNPKLKWEAEGPYNCKMENLKLDKDLLFLDIETATITPDFESLDDRLKPLWLRKAVFLRNDQEASLEELYFQRAGVFAEFAKIIAIAVGYFTRREDGNLGIRVKSLASENETEILQDFKEIIETKFDQRFLTLCAHNGKEFDFPFICRRFMLHNIKIPQVLDISGKKPWEVRHLDTMEMWKFGDKKSFTSLDLLAALFNIESSKKDLDGSMINQAYHLEQELDKIADYCRNDVVVLAQLFLKFKNLPTIKPENVTLV